MPRCFTPRCAPWLVSIVGCASVATPPTTPAAPPAESPAPTAQPPSPPPEELPPPDREFPDRLIAQLGPPDRLTAAQLVARADQYDDQYVEITDDYVTGFESSYLGDGSTVWLGFADGADVRCEPPRPAHATGLAAEHRYPVRVYGHVRSKDQHYGHLGGASVEVTAYRLVFLDPTRSECQ